MTRAQSTAWALSVRGLPSQEVTGSGQTIMSDNGACAGRPKDRRRRGTGTVYHRSDGRYCAEFRTGRPRPFHVLRRYVATEQDGDDWLAVMRTLRMAKQLPLRATETERGPFLTTRV